jgi:Family of unknown function (DUF6370)
MLRRVLLATPALVLVLVLLSCAAPSHSNSNCQGYPESSRSQIARDVEIGCALCIYRMPGVNDCVLAAKVDERALLVDGSGIDDHGDAHAADGLCNTARKVRAVGVVQGDRFVVTHLRAF